jgi:hypothetical protein
VRWSGKWGNGPGAFGEYLHCTFSLGGKKLQYADLTNRFQGLPLVRAYATFDAPSGILSDLQEVPRCRHSPVRGGEPPDAADMNRNICRFTT